MPLPDPLPARFTATLTCTVQASLTHGILSGGRQTVNEPDEGEGVLRFQTDVDREAGTVRLLGFPPVTDRVATSLGRVSATVTVEGEPEGRFDAETGHVEITVPLKFDPKHFLARSSRVTLALSSDAHLAEDDLTLDGDPLTVESGTLVLVGQGTFEGGSLDGGTLWLAIDGVVEAAEVIA